jgi:Family of unknown function (DUF6188)
MSQIIYPTPVGYGAIDLSWIVGRAVTDVSFVEPNLWRFFFGEPEHIDVECLWRIIKGEHIVRTSEDHGQQFGLPAPVDSAQEAAVLLSQATIVVGNVREATADILIEFSGGLRLEIISDSSGYESWQLYAPAGVCFVAQGGGQICTWTR